MWRSNASLSTYPLVSETKKEKRHERRREKKRKREKESPLALYFVTRTRDSWKRERHSRVSPQHRVMRPCRVFVHAFRNEQRELFVRACDVKTVRQSRTHRLPWKKALNVSIVWTLQSRPRRRAPLDLSAIERACRCFLLSPPSSLSSSDRSTVVEGV